MHLTLQEEPEKMGNKKEIGVAQTSDFSLRWIIENYESSMTLLSIFV